MYLGPAFNIMMISNLIIPKYHFDQTYPYLNRAHSFKKMPVSLIWCL